MDQQTNNVHTLPAEWPIEHVPTDRLRPDPATDFALSPVPEALTGSIRQLGVLTPLIACRQGEAVAVVCGHRRLTLLNQLATQTAPVRIAPGPLGTARKLLLQLNDNRAHRTFSDIETGRALIRLSASGMNEDDLVGNVLPLFGQPVSKKRLHDFLNARDFSMDLQQLLHDLALPLKTYAMIFGWDDAGRKAAHNLFTHLRPGANKCRDLLELIDETAHRDGQSPARLIQNETVQKTLDDASLSPGDRYQAAHRFFFQQRYPTLSSLRTEVRLALGRMGLDGKIRLRVPEHFESGEMKAEFTFHTREEFVEKVERLFAAADSEALDVLLKIVRSPESLLTK